MNDIIVGHVNHPPKGYQSVICDRRSFIGNPYTFKFEKHRDLSIKNCGLWLWDNFKLSEELDCFPIDMTLHVHAPLYISEGLHLAQAFKNPTVADVMRELTFIAEVFKRTGHVSLLCHCRGNPNPAKDLPCHCDRVKSCIEKLFL